MELSLESMFTEGKIGDDSYYRVWARDQEYAEGELMSGLPARDDGYARKAGFRFDKNLGRDLDFTFAGGFATQTSRSCLGSFLQVAISNRCKLYKLYSDI